MVFSKALIDWYKKNKRDLPFRKTKDPYRIWLSEIILQQTRVQQGLPYYEKFVKLFPSVHHLAGTNAGTVMKAWQGLGYYSRARNLHDTAKHISVNLHGKFPASFEEIKKLKGIGDYTAGAIASFAFNQPHAVVDGNVFRVLSRYFGIRTAIDSSEGKHVFRKKAESLLDKKNPGLFNQAIMEFGALQCVPQNPDCEVCPLNNNCIAYRKKLIHLLPIKAKKVKTRKRYFNYFVLKKNDKILIKKRTEKDIWQNLYDLPLLETSRAISKNKLIQLISDAPISIKRPSKTIKHILSHQIIFAKFWEIESLDDFPKLLGKRNKDSLYISDNQLNKFAFSRLIEKYFNPKLKE